MSTQFISFDYALKRVLRDKANYDVLEGFMSELLEYNVKVKDIVESELDNEKFNRVDILVENEKGELMMVELQFSYGLDYLLQMALGVGKIIINKKYSKLRKVIAINIVYFEEEQEDDYVYRSNTVFRGIHVDDELQPDAFQCERYGIETPADIYPEYYILKIKQFNDKITDKLDEWIYFLKHNSVKDEFTAKGLDKIRKVLLYENLTSEEKAEYDRIQDVRYQNWNMLYSAELKGKVEGRIEGRIEGRTEAREEYESKLAEKEAALARALAELAALKNNK
jgi:hypothetical protein